MFKKILVAYDESPESGRALLTAIELARSLNAELKAVSVLEKLPPYAGYIDAEVPGGTAALQKQASDYYPKLQADAQETARQHGVALTTELVEGEEVDGIVNFYRPTNTNLLLLLLIRHPFFIAF